MTSRQVHALRRSKAKIKVTKNGPYAVSGKVPMDKESIKTKNDCPDIWTQDKKYPEQESYRLCRCGNSKTPPYCDGTHQEINFDGKETAKNTKFEDRAEKISGLEIDLCDDVSLCASAKFCDRGKGVWQATEDSNDPDSKKLAIDEACNCPSGRLAMRDKAGKDIEPDFKPSISITEDPGEGVSGPIWVKGGVEIESADGKKYEKRNRVTLCRCGKSQNKPFCDGSHITSGFNDGDKALT